MRLQCTCQSIAHDEQLMGTVWLVGQKSHIDQGIVCLGLEARIKHESIGKRVSRKEAA
jgi:hypothetical protein